MKNKPIFHMRFSSALPGNRGKKAMVPALNLTDVVKGFNRGKTKGLTKKVTMKKSKEIYKIFTYPDPQKEFDSMELPVNGEIVLQKFFGYLTEYERNEVLNTGKIFFLPLNIPKLLIKDENFMIFDDEEGNYNLILGEHLAYRFEILEILGRGSFSQVCKCLDHRKGEIVAVKIIKNKKEFFSQSLVEVRLLENINQKDYEDTSNISHLKETFQFRNHNCLVFDLYSINLYQLLKLNQFKSLSQPLLKKIATQILTALKFLKTCHIIHGDIKPENILLKSSESSAVKVIDLGSGCYEHERVYSYLQARFYRAPEVILGLPYSTAIDMWSFGCVIAELHSAKPLFPSNNEVELMSSIQEFLDIPPNEMIQKALKKKVFFDRENRPRLIFDENERLRRPGSKRLEDFLKSSDSKFLDFISSNF
jgi:dual specificity tyrosine-phosphorylation-regulated kinase 2/3/4